MLLPPSAALLAAALLADPFAAADDPPTPVTDALRGWLDETVPALLEETGEPGLAVVLVEGGAVTHLAGFGLADRAAGRPVGPDTVFQVGSISKPVTAWGVLRLVEEGRFGLDDSAPRLLERWELPGGGFATGDVTVRRLLSHTAGLGQPSVSGFWPDEGAPSLVEELDAEVRIEAEPGTAYAYSGGGYTVLQLLVEETTGEPFALAMERLVLDPLGMASSRFGWDEGLADRLAVAYTTQALEGALGGDGEHWPDDRGAGHRALGRRAFTATAAAGLHTTARDLGRFLAAHATSPEDAPAGRGILPPATLDSMLQPVAPATAYGLGYELVPPLDGHAVVMHGGSNFGYRAHVMAIPDLGVAIAVLTNSDGGRSLRPVLGAWRDAVRANHSTER